MHPLMYFPYIQFAIIGLFVLIGYIIFSTFRKAEQNQVWAGMAKETAHQLGTPISSLEGWVEMLKEMQGNEKVAAEMSKDVERLKLVSDRFGKIGSTPQLIATNITDQVENMVNYIKRRSNEKVSLQNNILLQ